jgi:hypothetical protein
MIRNRLEKIDLTWVSQFIDILENELNTPASIKDIGCQAFQFYKEIKKRGLPYDYLGYELDQDYVDIGLDYFPELNKKFFVGDFAKFKEIAQTEASVCSATIEHIDDWVGFLQRILKSTSEVAIIRTFLGENIRRDLCSHLGAEDSYPIWQFSFGEFCAEVSRCGFVPEIRRDKYTDSVPKCLEVLQDGIVRTQYVIVARRRGGKL